VVIIGALPQDFFADDFHLVDVAEEVDDVLRTGEQGQMAEDDDSIKTVVYQGQQAAITALQRSPSVPPGDACVENKIIGQRSDGDQNFKYVWVGLELATPPLQF